MTLLLLGALTHPASAEDVPPPTVRATVTAADRELPKGLTAGGSWSVNRPGINARLSISAESLPGTRTVVEATWSSAVVRAWSDIPTFEVDFSWSHRGAVTATHSASVSYGFRTRFAGGRWTAWSDRSFPYPSGEPATSRSERYTISFPEADKRKGRLVQLQWRMRTELLSGGHETQSWHFLANV